MFLPICLDKQAYPIAQIVLQVAFFYIEYLVERSGDMESGSITIGKFLAAFKLLESKPATVREGILHLIAVAPYVPAAQCLRYCRVFHLGYTVDRVGYLTVLCLELHPVRQMLPPAAPAYGKMLARRLHTVAAWLLQCHDASLRI